MTKQEFIDAWFNCGILVEKYRKVMDTDLNLIIKFYTSQDKGVCKWKTDESNEGFITNCGHELTIFNNSGDLDNDFKEIGYIYCPYCQLKIERI